MRITAIGQGTAAVPALIFDQVDQLGWAVARRVLQGLRQAQMLGKPYLLGCPSGRSPRPVFQAMGRMIAEHRLDLRGLVIVMMDEYLEEADGGLRNCPIDAHYSCRRFGMTEIRDVLNRDCPAEYQLPVINLWTPDPADPAGYDRRLADAGGVDLFILASGASDGHVAFNGPGSPADSPCRVVKLGLETRQDNLGTFPQFKSISEVPRHGVTVGIRTLTALSRAVALVVHGEHKREAVRQLHGRSTYQPEWPISCVFDCLNPLVYLDCAAAYPELKP